MANELITPAELAVWCQTTEAAVLEDPFAIEVMTKVSDYVRFIAHRTADEWTYATAPFDVKLIVIWMCRRTYLNPDQETDSGVGPIRSSVLDEAALAMNLSASERETLVGYRADGEGQDGLWVMSIGGAEESVIRETTYVPDDQQINLGLERSWDIPMFNIDDPGSPE